MSMYKALKTLAFLAAVIGVASLAGWLAGPWCDAFFFLLGWVFFNTWCKRRQDAEFADDALVLYACIHAERKVVNQSIAMLSAVLSHWHTPNPTNPRQWLVKAGHGLKCSADVDTAMTFLRQNEWRVNDAS